VIRVARNREPCVRLVDIAKDFEICESCLNNWRKDADVEDGVRPGAMADERAENRELTSAAARARERGPPPRRGVSFPVSGVGGVMKVLVCSPDLAPLGAVVLV
jgi:hypothetical protein